MYCPECQKEIPDGAIFCAYCGRKLEASAGEKEEKARTAAVRPKGERRAHSEKAPQGDKSVVPLAENPAQPLRKTRFLNQEQSEPSPRSRLHHPEEKADGEAGLPVYGEGKKSAGPKGEKPRTRPHTGEVDDGGRPIPPRRAPVVPRKSADTTTDPCMVPPKRRPPQRNPYEELDRKYLDEEYLSDLDAGRKYRLRKQEEEYLEEEEDRVSHMIKSVTVGILLLLVLGAAFYLLVLPGGQKLCARMGFSAPASAYASLGQEYQDQGNGAKAAQAWYDALSRDPGNYEYALNVAMTQQAIGNRDRAITAYAKCISLRPDLPQPYQGVAEIYQQMGDIPRAVNALKTGYDRTGDLSLFRALEALSGQQEVSAEQTGISQTP